MSNVLMYRSGPSNCIAISIALSNYGRASEALNAEQSEYPRSLYVFAKSLSEEVPSFVNIANSILAHSTALLLLPVPS